METAEKIKMALSDNDSTVISEGEKKEKKDDILDVSKLGITEDLGVLSRKTLTDGIIKPRLTEIFTLIGMEIKRSGFSGMLPSGLVMTGGAAETVGLQVVGKEVLRMAVRIARPSGVTGLIDEILTPAYAASVGLLGYGEHTAKIEGMSIPIVRGIPLKGFLQKFVGWVKSIIS